MDAALWAMGSSGLLALASAWTMAGFVYVAAPSRLQNRLAALFLALVGFQVGATFGFGQFFQHLTGPMEAVAVTAHLSQSLVYLALLGTLDSPLSRPFRSRTAQRTLLAAAVAVVAAWPLYHRWMLTAEGEAGVAYFPALFVHGLALLFGFLVALSAWRRADPGSALRARGRAFTLAFGVRDVVFFVFISVAVVVATTGGREEGPLAEAWFFAQNVLVPLSVVAMVLLMGYGMAKAQLFEVDRTLRLGVRHGTVAGAFVAVFFVASQLIESLSGDTFGLVGGAVASGLLLFAIAPLQRAAERVSGAVVPDARPLRERPDEERAQLYREQVRIAWEDGHLGLKERRMLDAARERLGLGAEAALSLETEVVRAMAAPSASPT